MNMAEAAPNPNPAPGEEFLTSVPDSWRSALVQRSSSERRITVMEDSLRCHAYGWLSLVPLAGIGFVVLAVRMFRRVDRERSEWNPAQHLWLRGLVLACFGFWTNLAWWSLLVCWLGNTVEFKSSYFLRGDGVILLLYALFFGSAPTLFGLGWAATRWSTRFGAFVHRYRGGLLSLMGVVFYLAIFLLASRLVTEDDQREYGSKSPSHLLFYSLTAIWLTWVFGGFVSLAGRNSKPVWWSLWLAGAAVPALLLIGDLALSFNGRGTYVMIAGAVGAGVGASAAVCFRQRWLALGCFVMALSFWWLSRL
ncbi:MAG: hypothetical protein WCS99_15695 [Limisphaerales bacterium]